ncbi:hypothetical protein CSOJ01_07223 [Colletotrichum sojae]|uniref:Uncharacterized protein n=1 Tax=Colletotrichum sojae TaxID=2175907 RepID=A0A8H6MUM8_9PEZI|nr:hypothetical protein CSOJ01_07223 [Colletotrichum sojae]
MSATVNRFQPLRLSNGGPDDDSQLPVQRAGPGGLHGNFLRLRDNDAQLHQRRPCRHGVASELPTPLPTQCPTVYTTGTVCGTCIQPMCVKLSQIYNLCHCPTVVPTVSVAYPCDGPCPGGCAGTQYFYASNTPTCSATAPY